MPEGLWHKCPDCGAIIHEADLQQHYHVCPKCEHHFIMGSKERIKMLVDPKDLQDAKEFWKLEDDISKLALKYIKEL